MLVASRFVCYRLALSFIKQFGVLTTLEEKHSENFVGKGEILVTSMLQENVTFLSLPLTISPHSYVQVAHFTNCDKKLMPPVQFS